MPTAYIKKLAKLNHTTVNKLEKFWSQAKEIAKSEGNGKAWGLITTIFQNKLKKEGYKVKAFSELNMKPYSYKGQIITASSKQEAITKIVASSKSKLNIPKFPRLKEITRKESDDLSKNPDFNKHSEPFEKHKSFLDSVVKKLRATGNSILNPSPYFGSYTGCSHCVYDDNHSYRGYVGISDDEANFSVALDFSFNKDDYKTIVFIIRLGGFNLSNCICFCTSLSRSSVNSGIEKLFKKIKTLLDGRTKSKSNKVFIVDTDDWSEKELGEPEDVAKKIEEKLGKCVIRYEYDVMRIMLPDNTKTFEDTISKLKSLLGVDVQSVTKTTFPKIK